MDRHNCHDLLTHHEERLAKLIELLGHPLRVDRSRENTDDLAGHLCQEIRLELKRDFDVGERREWSRLEVAYVQPALYGAYAELSSGKRERPQRMLNNAKRAHQMVSNAIHELKRSGEARERI